MEDISQDKDKLIEALQNAVDAENMMHFCCSHLAYLIKNGRVRNRFGSLSQAAEKNKGLLINHLNNLRIGNFLPEDKCRFCSVKAESFSLLGAINLGLEVVNISIRLYRDLSCLAEKSNDRKLYKKILNEKFSQINFLKKEKKFVSKDELKLNLIGSYCIPEVVSRLRE